MVFGRRVSFRASSSLNHFRLSISPCPLALPVATEPSFATAQPTVSFDCAGCDWDPLRGRQSIGTVHSINSFSKASVRADIFAQRQGEILKNKNVETGVEPVWMFCQKPVAAVCGIVPDRWTRPLIALPKDHAGKFGPPEVS